MNKKINKINTIEENVGLTESFSKPMSCVMCMQELKNFVSEI
jgi:hypothetical protein